MDLVSFETPIEFKMFEEVMIAGKFFNILLCTFLLDVLFIFELRKFLHNVEISKIYFNGINFVKIFVKSFSSNFFTM